jgi:hypothetical protein
MKKKYVWLVLGAVLLFVYFFRSQLPHIHWMAIAKRVAPPAAKRDGSQGEAQAQAEPTVSVDGALVSWMQKRGGEPETITRGGHALDHIAASPVGDSDTILHKTFAISDAMDFPFEIPPHAATPNLRGTFRSFVQKPGAISRQDSADVDFLILDEEQYADFTAGRPGEALFSAETTHNQNVNFRLPVSQSLPQKYHLIFRNASRSSGKKLVEADFTVSF